MKESLLSTILFLAVFLVAGAQESIFPKGNLAPNVHHTGDVWLNHVVEPDENFNWSVAQAVSASGARLNWHLHPKGQQLLITHGVGFYQEKNKEVRVVRAGDVILCPPNVEHWHGAAPNSAVTYLAISGKDGPTQWTDALTDETYNAIAAPDLDETQVIEEIKALSREKWNLMAAKDAEKLAGIFHPKAQFVHMGGSWGTERELNIIKSGNIWYKKADIHKVSVDIIGDSAILLNHITLLAEVGGNEVRNPFIVTEVYHKENERWKLTNLSFVKQLVQD